MVPKIEIWETCEYAMRAKYCAVRHLFTGGEKILSETSRPQISGLSRRRMIFVVPIHALAMAGASVGYAAVLQ
jgi:hypothetical protein